MGRQVRFLAVLLAFAGFADAQSALPRVVWVSPTASGQSGPFFEELRRGPGRNMTGISCMTLDLVGKRMEMLKEVLPKAKQIAVVAIEQTRSDAVMFFPTQTVIASRALIAEWSLKRKLPTISGWAQFADGGNLLSYGPNLADASRRLAYYVDRILKGAKPGDLPVELPTRVELVINQKTARAIGVSVPALILLRADRVIE